MVKVALLGWDLAASTWRFVALFFDRAVVAFLYSYLSRKRIQRDAASAGGIHIYDFYFTLVEDYIMFLRCIANSFQRADITFLQLSESFAKLLP